MKRKRTLLMLLIILIFATSSAAFAQEPTTEPAEAMQEHLHETEGTLVISDWEESPKYDFNTYCYYNQKYENSLCVEDYCTHMKVYDYSTSGVLRGWHCSKCSYYSWK